MEQHYLTYRSGGVEVGGVVEVESFDQKCVLLKIDGGMMEIRGGGFILKDMISESGKLTFSGRIRSLEYKEKLEPSSVFKKLFK